MKKKSCKKRAMEYMPRLTLEQCNKKNTPRFTIEGAYRAKITKVYDGDSITCAMSLNGDDFYRFSIRLNGIDTPELRGGSDAEKKQGLLARDYLRGLILDKVIFVVCTGLDKYGRVLGTLYMKEGDLQSVNDLMIEKGYAYAYDGGTKQKFAEPVLE